MKNKIKLLSIAFAMVMLGDFYVNAQNHFWTLPPNSIYEGQPPASLPIPTLAPEDDPWNYYDGSPAQHAHNSISKPNGELLFFVVDHKVYDGNGLLIGDILASPEDFQVRGASEIVIIPDHELNCDRFYIVTAGREYLSDSQSDVEPYYVLVDMSLPNAVFPEDGLGAFVEFDGSPAGQLPAKSLQISGVNFSLPQGHKKIPTMAASNARPDGSRLLFVSNGSRVFRYKIDHNGLFYDNATFDIGTGANASFPPRSEMELYEREEGGYRLAVPYNVDDGNAVWIVDADEDGDVILATEHHVLFEKTSESTPHLNGIEFSPNGEILYCSHAVSVLHPNPIEYYDIINSTNGEPEPLVLNNAADFQFSQIEIGIDGKLYLATSNRLATIDNSNDPTNLIWNDQAIIGISYDFNYEGTTPVSDLLKLYTLPDQIDTMDYSQYPFCPYTTHSVSGVETWTPENNPLSIDTSLVRIKEELRFESGSHITLKNMRFEFFDDARVVIEPGARLTLDSTTFTIGPCYAKMWLGVEVWGTPSESQYVSGNYHGQLVLKNNSVIEHAYIGALAGSREGGTASNLFWYEKAGGIIRGFDSRFRNNMRDVLIQNHYSYNSYGDLISNVSRFNNCDFLTDGLLNHPETTPMAHATLYRVHNVRFDNCSFRNTASFQDLPIEKRGIGIYAVQATFKANGNNDTYEPADDALAVEVNAHQSFYQLKVGVLSIGNENHFFTVNKMEFQLNHTGIYVFGSCLETITYNNFQVPEAGGNFPPLAPIDNIGVYLINSYLFTVEENTFFSSPVDTPNGGLVVDNSSIGDDPVENEVYRNEFYGLDFGIGVKRDNRDARSNRGLQARCNVFSDINVGDIILNPQSEWRDNQGEVNPEQASTNNVFSHLGYACSYPFRELLVSDEYGSESIEDLSFDYYHLDDPISTPDMDAWHSSCPQNNFANVLAHIGVTLDYEEHCPSNFSTGGGNKWPLVELEVKLATAESNLVSAQNIYQATIDGGETEDIIDLLENVFNEESAYLRDLLMERYPLSREALMAAIDAAESFDPWHLTQVLVANSRLPVDVYQFLKDNEVLAPFFMQFVDDAQTSGMAPFRTLLKSEISLRSYEKSQAERAINRHYLHHADSLDGTTWNNFVESRDEPYYQLYRIGTHNDKGETGAAQALLDSLDLNTDRAEWVQFMIDLAAADTVTANDLSTGWDFFYNKPSTIGHAWGWLVAHGELDSLPSFEIEPQHRSLALSSHNDPTKPERWLQAWPNPAKDRVVLTYPKEAEGMGVVQLFNADGRMMQEFTASDAGFQEIDLTGWPNGLYIAKLIVNGKDFETVKISVVN